LTIAPVTPPPTKLPAAVAKSNPPPLAAPLSAGIKLCKIVPPIPLPAAPEIVLTRGLRGAPTYFAKRRPPNTR